MRLIKICFIFIFFLIYTPIFAANKLVHYEPEVAKLTGMIKIKIFPGPPNFESIKNGDAKEEGGYLILDQPIDVDLVQGTTDSDDDINEPEKNIRLLQLVIHSKKHWDLIKNNNRVRITGTLFHAHTGHHHAQVSLEIQHIERI